MLRIIETRNDAEKVMLSLEGSLTGPWTEELARVVAGVNGSRSLTLDVSAVTFVDRESLTLLQDLARRGARFERCTAYLRILLKGACSPAA